MNHMIAPGLPRHIVTGYLKNTNRSDDDKIDSIISLVTQHTKVSKEEMVSRCRKREIAEARQMAITLIFSHTKLSLVRVGKLFDRDHSTVISSLKKVQDLIDTDRAFKALYYKIDCEI